MVRPIIAVALSVMNIEKFQNRIPLLVTMHFKIFGHHDSYSFIFSFGMEHQVIPSHCERNDTHVHINESAAMLLSILEYLNAIILFHA